MSLVVDIYNFTQGQGSIVLALILAPIYAVYYLGFTKFDYSKPWLPGTLPQTQ